MIHIWDRDFAAKADERTIASGVPEQQLMQSAGQSVANALLPHLKKHDSILVLIGKGHNGEDARIAGDYLKSRTFSVIEWELKNFSQECLRDAPKNPVVIDGLLGLGFTPPLQDPKILSMMESVRMLKPKFVCAVDLPSGLSANQIFVSDETKLIPADLTVTFGELKPCHVLSPSRDLCGKVVVADIGFEKTVVDLLQAELPPLVHLAEEADLVSRPFAYLKPSAHKFDRGHVLVIGGSVGKLGAPLISATAALRAGSGWVSVALSCGVSPQRGIVPQGHLELTYEDFFRDDRIHLDELKTFVRERNVSAIVLGPGTMKSPLDPDILEYLARQSHESVGVVIDAGATLGIVDLFLAHHIIARPSHFILTPHPGEWRRMASVTAKEIFPRVVEDLSHVKLVHALSHKIGVTFCYKGATPLFIGPLQPAICSPFTDHRIAKAGTGDAFAGATAALSKAFGDVSKQGLQALGMLGQACQRAQADSSSSDGVLISDILNYL